MSTNNSDNITFKEKYNSTTTWQEKAVLIFLYHQIMCIKYSSWNLTDTSKHFEISIGLASENIRLAKEITEGNKKLMNCKTREDGLKLMDRRRYSNDRNDHIILGDDDD